jgi:uncharacterized protein (TIGR00725 family)
LSKLIAVFGSSLACEGSSEYAIAYDCGKYLAEAGFSICNGGYGGVMEASAKGAREAGGSTVGVTVNHWERRANEWIEREIKTSQLIDRLTKLVELGDAYVILKGGTGTLLEFACVLELMNKDLMKRKPIVLVGDFWGKVVETLRLESSANKAKDCTDHIHGVQNALELAHYLKTTLLP